MSAYIKRNTVYCEDNKVILFLLPKHLEEMIYSKDNGDEPSDTITTDILIFVHSMNRDN